jgi:pimeloyl-ACP methyl ester carboxylesterase
VVAAEAARRQGGRIAGVVLLAGPARPLAQALEARLRVRLSAAGELPGAIDAAVAALRREIDALRELPDGAPLRPGQAVLRDLAVVDPAILVASVRLPTLIVHGSADLETPSSQVSLMRASLVFSAERARFELVDGADHDLLVAPPARDLTSAPNPADVARRLHPGVVSLVRAFATGTRLGADAAESR